MIFNIQKNNLYIIFFYILIGINLTILFNGFENISFENTKWLFSKNDMSGHHIGWYFFKDDIWRFPLGSNPNYGDGIGNSIVYSDSIPLFALMFKLINFILPEKFQYFSLWFMVCFFLQGFLSFLLIFKYTSNKSYSIIGSIFFIFYPILIYRFGWHPALFGQWTLLLSAFLVLEKDQRKTEKFWVFLILLTSLIHFYFTFINLIIYNFFKFYSFIKKQISLKKYFVDFVLLHSLLLVLMLIVGYFEVRIYDTIALGFGVYKLNLLSILDSTNNIREISWSWFMPDIKLAKGEELEGFNYLGFGGLLLIFLSSFLFFVNNKARIFLKNNFDLKIILIMTLITALSLSNNISFGSYDIIQIPFNKLLYGFFSIIRSSGRLFWFVNYLIILISIIIIFKCFDKQKSIAILSLMLFIQLFDTLNGLKDYIGLNKIITSENFLKDKFWNENKEIKKVFTTHASNYNKYFDTFAPFLEENKIIKTNLVKSARIDRKKIAENRYNLYDDLRNKKIKEDTIYVIDNIGHLLTLKEIFKNENVGFFYRDKVWVMIAKHRNVMSNSDKMNLKKIEPKKIKFNRDYEIGIRDNFGILGFGWTHNFDKNGAWSEGKFSNLLFTIEDISKDLVLEIECAPFINEKLKNLNLGIFVNNKFNNKIKFDYDSDLTNKNRIIKIKISKEKLNTKNIELRFQNNNPISPLDLLINPDSRKLGFNIKKIRLSN